MFPILRVLTFLGQVKFIECLTHILFKTSIVCQQITSIFLISDKGDFVMFVTAPVRRPASVRFEQNR